MGKTSWAEKKTNLEVLKDVKVDRDELKSRDIKFLGNVIRHDDVIAH